jgi:hypothetical protein
MCAVSKIVFAAVLLTAFPACSTPDDLKPLADALSHVRSSQNPNPMRGVGPELTAVKQALRIWVEGRLPPRPLPVGPNEVFISPGPDDMASLSERVNITLDAAGLTCGNISDAYRCAGGARGWDDERGYVEKVRIASLDYDRYMLVVTAVGIRCGFDESAYLYKRGSDHKWTLLFKSEEDDYRDKEYAAQHFLSIAVSPANVAWNEPAQPPLILTLGYSPWCSSNWNGLTTRSWRASDSNPTPPTLIDRQDTLYTGDDMIASARLTQKDLLIEFRGQSIDGATLIRSHVEHYLIGDGDKLKRIAPVALNPNDFVEEWLTSDWSEAGQWIGAKGDKAELEKLHETSTKTFGEFEGPPRRCRSDPTLWQTGYTTDENNGADLGQPNHFLVRWMAPYRFSLVGVQRAAFSGCDEEVAMPDDIGTLFPEQGWTP